jgi:pectin methylesterase-like acyl-CoA thioesterase
MAIMQQTKTVPAKTSVPLAIVLCCAWVACSSSSSGSGEGGRAGTGGRMGLGGSDVGAGGSGTGGAVGSGGSPGAGGSAPLGAGGSGLGGSAARLDASVGAGGQGDGAGGAFDAGKVDSGGTTADAKIGTGGATGDAAAGGRSGTGGSGAAGADGDPLCPPGITQTITVAKDGSGQFTKVQAAVDSIASGSTAHIRINIKAGTYTEKLTIASRTNLCLVGDGATTTILAYGDSNASTGGTSTSASVHISANDFSAANLTFQNTYGSGSQAVALRTTGQRQQFLNCRFVGYQDTLYTHNGSQYFRNCYVQGNTDYVFGGATAVLQDCEARNVEGGSAVTAPNTDASTAYGIVFLGGKFTAASGVKAGSVAMGRPWGAAGFAAFLNVDLGAHIAASGFVAMSGNQPQSARFHEYASKGSAASTSSRSSYQLSASQAASYTLANILGTWTPSYSE